MESDDFNKGIETTMDVQWDNLRTYRKHHECGMCGKADHVRQCSTGGCYVHTKDRGTKIDSPDAEQYLYPLDRYLGAKPGLTQPEEWRPEAPPPSPSNDSDFFERAQSLVREAETQLDCFRKIYNIDSESDQQQPKVTQSVPCPTESSGQVSHPNRIRNIVVALDALQAESSRLEDDVLRARAFAKDISDEIGSDCKPSKSSRTCQRRPCERKTRNLVSERSRDSQERVKERTTIPSPRKQAEYPRSETTSASTYDAEQKKLSPPSRRRCQRLTWHTNLLRAKSSTEGTDDGYNTSDGRRAEKKCKCAINKKKCLCLSYHRKVPEKPIVESSCACGSRKCSCSSKEVKSSPKWQLSRYHSNVNMCPCCEQQERDHVTTVVKKKYTPGCCKATLIDVKTQQWSTEEEEVNRKKLPLAKLTIQELPSINIRRELKIQRVPSYDLPKPPGEEIPYTPRENVGLIDITHDDTIRERQSQWRKGDNIRRVRRSSYIGENISDSEVHHAHHVEKEVVVVRPANHSSKPGPSKPCTHKASRSIPCQCSLRSHKSVHFSGVEERTFMFDLNHGRSFSLERHSSETEYSGLDPSELCEMMGLRDSNFARRPFDDTDYDSETGSICARCRSLSCSSHRRAAGTKPVPKVSSQEQPREKQEPKDARPVPKPKKQIPIPQEREQDLDPVRPCRKSDNLLCKSRKTLEEVRTADVSSTVQQREESIQTGVPLVGDRQEETVLKSALMPCKPQQSSTGLQKRDQASAQPQLSPPKAKKSKCLVKSRITQTSYSPQDTQEGPSTSRQWEHSSGVETHSLPCKCRKNLEQARPTGISIVPEERLHHMERSLGGQQAGTEARSPPCKSKKNLEQARPTGMSVVPEERPATLHHMERSLGGDRTGTEARSPPCKHKRNLVQTVTTQMSYIPQEEPSASHQWEQSPGAEPQLPPHKHTKTSDQKQEPTTTAVPKTKIARQERKTFPFPDSSYIPIVAMAPFPPPAKDKRTKRSESRKTVPRSEKSQERQRTVKMDQNSVFPDVSCIPMVIQSPKGIESLYDTDYPDEAAVDRRNARLVSSTSPRREVRSNRSPSDTPTITVYSSKDPASKRQEMRAAPADDEAREMKHKAPADRCSCAEPGGKCSCVPQREEGNVKVDKGEGKHSEYVKFDVKGKPNLNSVKKSKRAHLQGIFEPLAELPCEDLWKISSNKETDAVVQGESNTSTGFVPQDDLSPNNAVPQSLRLGSGITVTDFLSAGSVMRHLFTSQKTEDASTLCVSGVPYLAPDSLHHSKMRLSHTSHPRSENEEAQLRTTFGEANADRLGRSRGGTTLVSPATPESPEGERASDDVTSTATIKHLQKAIMSRVENAIMKGLLDESETSDSPSEVASTQQDIASPEVKEAAALPAEYEEDFESEEEEEGAGAEDEPVSEDLVGSEATAESVAEDSQESSLPTSQEAALVKRSESSQTSSEAAVIKHSESSQTSSEAAAQTSFIKRSEIPQTSSEAAVIKRSESSQTSSEAAAQTSFIKHSEIPQTSSEAAVIKRSESSQTSSEAAVQTSFIKRSQIPQSSPEVAVQTSFIKHSEPPQTSPEAAAQTSFIKRSEIPQRSPEVAVQTSFIKRSEPPQTSPEAAAQTSFIQPSSSSVDSPEVTTPMSPSRSSSSTVKTSPRPSEPAPPSSFSKKLPGPSGQTSQRPSSVCPVLKPSLCPTLPPALKKPSVDSSLVSSPKKSTAETPTELSPPRTPALSPKKASPSRSPVKTPPLSPEPGSFSPVPSAKMTPLLSPESFSSDTEERVIRVTTPPITPPRSPSSSLADVETPSPTENQQPNIESWQDNAPVQRVPEPRQRRVEEILIPIESERTDVSCTILSDSLATDRTSETAVSVDEEEPVLSEGEIRPDPCPCKKCRRSCVCPSVSKGEIRQPCRCACSVGEARPQTDDSIGEVRHHKHTCRHHSHRSSTYSDGQVLACRVPRRREEMYSMGEVAHDDTYSAGQIQSPHIEVYLSPSLTGDSSDSELCGSASLCEELFDQEIHLPSVSNGSDEQSQTILSLGQLSEDDSGL